MKRHAAVDVLRVLLGMVLLFILFLQLVGLPWASGELAAELPDEAFMRWPILILSIIGLACVQAGLVCVFQLLGFTRKGEVFSPRALRWVNGIIGASLAGSVVCLATMIYQSFTVGGPFLFALLLVLGVLVGIGMALLVSVMRTLLVQATTLRSEMEAVI